LPHLFRRLGSLLVISLILWLGGLGWFVVASIMARVDRTSPTDAIVVLTGGRMRLETGLDLLAAGKAGKLFVSGVNPRVDRDTLLRALGPAAAREACCIVLGHSADNTAGNARETASWMQQEGYRSLRLVTSWYHMRRSLLEFGRAMPQVAVIAHPVFARDSGPEGWRDWLAAAPLVVAEYHKFGAAWLRLLVEDALNDPPSIKPVVRTVSPGGGGDWPRGL
jgi:uncharacterized SAM-binding protein YcdF (DUF218 family)